MVLLKLKLRDIICCDISNRNAQRQTLITRVLGTGNSGQARARFGREELTDILHPVITRRHFLQYSAAAAVDSTKRPNGGGIVKA